MFVRTESFKQFIKLYPVITVIIALHILIYLAINLPIFPRNHIFGLLAGHNYSIMNGEYWRLVTPIIVHADLMHLVFNSFSLVLFGPALERALGKLRFTLVYFACGILANIATLYVYPPSSVHIGASGAIFGLFGIYLAIYFFQKEAMPLHARQIIIPIIIIGVVMTFFTRDVNIAAHIFGLISGLLIGRIILHFRSIRFY